MRQRPLQVPCYRTIYGRTPRTRYDPGTSKSAIVSEQVWLADMADFAGMNGMWDQWVDPVHSPARATGGVALARPGMCVEMIVVAYIL